ncbi:MAG: hypothetical protein M3248_04935 [Actinomycetota bacterium]|nr:hypothetical protein [Actinomycetota bacterium]
MRTGLMLSPRRCSGVRVRGHCTSLARIREPALRIIRHYGIYHRAASWAASAALFSPRRTAKGVYSSPGGTSFTRHSMVRSMKKLLTPTALALVLSAGIFNGSSAVAGPDPTKMVCGTTNCATDAPKSPVGLRDPVKAKSRVVAGGNGAIKPKRKTAPAKCAGSHC